MSTNLVLLRSFTTLSPNSFVLSILHIFLFLGVKGMKGTCFGHFFGSHFFMGSHAYGIKYVFLMLICLMSI